MINVTVKQESDLDMVQDNQQDELLYSDFKIKDEIEVSDSIFTERKYYDTTSNATVKQEYDMEIVQSNQQYGMLYCKIKDEIEVSDTIFTERNYCVPSNVGHSSYLYDKSNMFGNNVEPKKGNKNSKVTPKSKTKIKKIYECPTCLNTFNDASNFNRHKKIHAGLKRKDDLPCIQTCHICNKTYKCPRSFKLHISHHLKGPSHECTICPKKFYRSDDCKLHIMSHTGERPFICKICNKTFTCKSSLKRHLSTHVGQKPHKCDVCDSKFTRANDKNVHMRKYHIQNEI